MIDERLSHIRTLIVLFLAGLYLLARYVPVAADLILFQAIQTGIGVVILFFLPGYLFFTQLELQFESYAQGLIYILLASIVLSTVVAVLVNELAIAFGTVAFAPNATVLWVFVAAILATFLVEGTRPLPEAMVSGIRPRQLVPLCALPVLSVFGGRFLTWYSLEIVNIGVVVAAIALAAVLLVSDANETMTRIGLLSISLSLMWHAGLAGNYLWGWDIHIINFYATQVAEANVWDITIEASINALPIMVVLPVVTSNVTTLGLEWVYKLVFTTVYASFPIVVYLLARQWFDRRYALFSALLICGYTRFFIVIPGKQHLAQLFVAGVFLSFFDPELRKRRALIAVVFMFGVLMSHYGTAFLFSFFLLGGYLYYRFSQRTFPHQLIDASSEPSRLTMSLVAFYTVTLFAWFLHVAGGTVFRGVMVFIPYSIITNLVELLTETESRTGASKVEESSSTSLLKQIHLYVYLTLALGSGLGFLRDFASRIRGKPSRFSDEWVALSVPFLSFAALGFFLRGNFGIDRVIDIVLVMLAPLMALSMASLASFLNQHGLRFRGIPISRVGVAGFIIAFMSFNSGVIYVTTGEDINFTTNSEIYFPYYGDADADSSAWLAEHAEGKDIHTDRLGMVLLHRNMQPSEQINIPLNETDTPPDGVFVYFWSWNNQEHTFGFFNGGYEPRSMNDTAINSTRQESHRVFTTGNSTVYLTRNTTA